MSFVVHPVDRSKPSDCPQGPQVCYPLKAERTIRVPPISRAVVPHGISITPLDPTTTLILLLRKPWVWAELDLLIDVGEVDPADPIVTRVFNLSAHAVVIRQGLSISHLVSLPLSIL